MVANAMSKHVQTSICFVFACPFSLFSLWLWWKEFKLERDSRLCPGSCLIVFYIGPNKNV